MSTNLDSTYLATSSDVPVSTQSVLEQSPLENGGMALSSSRRPPIRWLGITFPHSISSILYTIGDFGQHWRHKTIDAAPNIIANHSSNIVALTHLAGEMMMFKANNTTFVPEQYKGVWWRYIVEPPKSVLKSVFQHSNGFRFSDLKKSGYITSALKNVFNTEAATIADKAAGKTLINNWQARSTFVGLIGMTIAASFPDVKDKEKDIEQRMTLSSQHPLLYVAQNIGEGIWFPMATLMQWGKKIATLGQSEKSDQEVGHYKRQFTGLSMTIAGICSFLSGFRNVGYIDKSLSSELKKLPANLKYNKNWAHSTGGAITAFAGLRLLLATGSDQGWARWGETQWLRMAFLPKSITSKFKSQDTKPYHYLSGQVLFQLSNTISYLLGGAEKLDDGTIVDHKAAREEVKRHIQKEKIRRAGGQGDYQGIEPEAERTSSSSTATIPAATISAIGSIERAMPERHVASMEATAG